MSEFKDAFNDAGVAYSLLAIVLFLMIVTMAR
jgi:hypothetical protein